MRLLRVSTRWGLSDTPYSFAFLSMAATFATSYKKTVSDYPTQLGRRTNLPERTSVLVNLRTIHFFVAAVDKRHYTLSQPRGDVLCAMQMIPPRRTDNFRNIR